MTPPPILAGSWFGPEDKPHARLARACVASAARWCPDWDRRIEHGPPPPAVPGVPGIAVYTSFSVNAHKMTRWTALLEGAADGDRILFIDADTVILRPLDPIWEQPFDLAYTVRLRPPFPINSGVVAVRVSPAIRRFFKAWHATAQQMLRDTDFHQTWRRLYGGIHQAALGHLLSTGATLCLEVRELPCLEWNCEDTSWAAFDPAITRIVHVKSTLRRVVLGYTAPQAYVKPLVAIWRAIDASASETVIA